MSQQPVRSSRAQGAASALRATCAAPLPPDEPARQGALDRYRIVDTPEEREFDEMARLASVLCDTPFAAITFVTRDRQWFKAHIGFGLRESHRDLSICAHAILSEGIVEIADARRDDRIRHHPIVAGPPNVRFYAAATLRSLEGHALGTLCVMDVRTRRLSDVQRLALRTLADQVMAQLELRRLIAVQHENEARLREADARKDEFLAMLAHELRNPLAPLANALHVLRRRPREDETDVRMLAMADRQVGQLRRLVDDLLEVGRITRGKIALQRESVEIGAAVRAAAESVAERFAARRQRLSLRLSDVPVHAEADPARIAQVLGNLLNNASKYTPDDGSAWVGVRDDGETVEIRVGDDGIGIEADKIPMLFELFTQIDATIDRAQGGLGIGLAMVRRLVELHGGSVAADSAGLGHGSTFTVRLPKREPPADAVTPS